MGWQNMLRESSTQAEELAAAMNLSEQDVQAMNEILDKYPMKIPEYYRSLIDFSDPQDPIRKMAIPEVSEFQCEGTEDTSGECSNTVIQGMQHKYGQTALILSTNQCAMYCRHCFRKRMVGSSSDEIASQLGEMADYVSRHQEITNILISGGDSFLNSTAVIRKYLEIFTQIDHLDFIRFGTRVPVVLPQRITEDQELLDCLEQYSAKKQLFVITQFNHPKELTLEAKKAIDALLKRRIVVRNQTVLLKGVNDDPQVLGELFSKLTRFGVTPYYIFQCRPALGVKNQFQVPLRRGYEIVEAAKQMQNGQGKSVRYCLSHVTGKIEILGGMPSGEMLFKYHQAKYSEDASRIFTVDVENDQCWLDFDDPHKEAVVA
ncbi:KamA family radical SAM protein [Cuneatibacter sp. NSJ-177]|uniref:KamA family radical SAM protein n=1 Tax=Cuneatibacter sp. NSJ-177 TaxID=2931401 RepID=UPI001FD52D56|nr:KamA family radical SAM protein [Cuneatibacter sp. NSJ-177]MCJ7837198.1 KamA family radical SAM protein [Cuneatibacter sp. NSJ-177]